MTRSPIVTLTRVAACLPVILLACSQPPKHQVFAGSLDHGDKPGTGLKLTIVGERVEGGTFSILDPDEPASAKSLHYPIQVLSQGAGKLSFRVDLQVGNEKKPFFLDASLARQADGTLHVWVDRQGANTPRQDLGPPMILEPVDK
jgi:hypothetical protein